MPQNPPADMPRITPYLYYEDVAGALEFLTRSFGFSERMRMPGSDGIIMHAEIELADGLVMLGRPGPDYSSPKAQSQSLYVFVDDVDKHCKQAAQSGARIVAELEDQFYGDRRYGAEDSEGHLWYFAQRVRDVAPEDMKPPE